MREGGRTRKQMVQAERTLVSPPPHFINGHTEAGDSRGDGGKLSKVSH